MNYLAFDLETARVIPAGEDWRDHRPLGITCYGLAWRDGDEIKTQVGFGKDESNSPQPQMSRAECRVLVEQLVSFVDQGYMLLTWNGLGFDFDILAEESGMHTECCKLALDHVDMMFHLVCLKGYMLGLDAAAKGMGLAGKLEGMKGSEAPLRWQQGATDTVLAYVAQDALMTLSVGEAVEARGQIRWRRGTGKANRIAIPQWLKVSEALALPLPNVSHLRRPVQRERFTAWMARQP